MVDVWTAEFFMAVNATVSRTTPEAGNKGDNLLTADDSATKAGYKSRGGD